MNRPWNPGGGGAFQPVLAWLAISLGGTVGLLAQCTVTEQECDDIPGPEVVMENEFLRAVVYPASGGTIGGLTYKPTGQTLASAKLPLFSDKLWDQGYDGDWSGSTPRPYQAAIGARGPGEATVALKRTGNQGANVFVTIEKRYTIRQGSATLEADYTIRNAQEAMGNRVVKFWCHNGAWVGEEGGRYYVPCESGIQAHERQFGKVSDQAWHYDPARGWTGFISAGGAGLVFEPEHRYLHAYYDWLGENMATVEWRYLGQPVAANGSWSTRVRVTPFAGLSSLAGAGQGIVGSLEAPTADQPGKPVTLTARLVSGASVSAELAFRARALPRGEWLRLGEGPKRIELQPSATPVTVSTTWTPPAVGLYAIEAVVGKGETALCRLDASLRVGAGAEVYRLEPEGERVGMADRKAKPQSYLSMAIETPHFPWARPYFSGPIRALFLTGLGQEREVVELAQRIDLKWDHAYADKSCGMDQYNLEQQNWTSETIDKAIAEGLAKDHEVVILGGIKWDDLAKENQAKLLEKVRAGCGLVYVQPRNIPGDLADSLPQPPALEAGIRANRAPARALARHYLTGALPWEALPAVTYFPYTAAKKSQTLLAFGDDPFVTAGELGKGRVVGVLWNVLYRNTNTLHDVMPGLTPDTLIAAGVGFPYREYFHALLARTVAWAAKRDAPLTIEEVRLGADQLTVKLAAERPEQATARVFVRNRYGEELARLEAAVKAGAGSTDVSFPRPANLPGGPLFADVQVLNPKGALAWGGAVLRNDAGARVMAVELKPTDVVKAGDPVDVQVRLDGQLADTRVKLEVRDGYRRLVQVAEAATADTNRVAFAVDTSRCLGRLHTVKAMLTKGAHCLDERTAEFTIRPDQSWNRFVHLMWWDPLETREYLLPHYSRQMRKVGVNAAMPYWPYKLTDTRWLARENYRVFANGAYRLGYCLNDPTLAQKIAEYGKTRDKRWLIQEPPLVDEAAQGKRLDSLRRTAAINAPYGLLGWCIGDESSLMLHGTELDECWHPKTLAAMRAWLKTQYADLNALNREWETNHKTWDEVVPMTTDEALARGGRNYAPWSDHRAFMEKAMADTWIKARATLREQDPQARMGISGTDQPQPYNGLDWWRLRQCFDFAFTYGTGDYHRSFNPDMYVGAWTGYWLTGPVYRASLWSSFLNGRGMVAHWYAQVFVRPGLDLTPTASETGETLRPVDEGIGDLLMAARRSAAVAVYYSQRSVHGSFISDPRRFRLFVSGHVEQYAQALRDLGVGYNYVSYEQVAQGELGKGGYKLLVMPHTIALSEAEAQAIRAWVRAGGVLVGDAKIGLLDGHCRGAATPLLDEVFGIAGQSYDHAAPRGEVEITENLPAGPPLKGVRLPATIIEETLKLTTGKAFARGAAPPPKQHGDMRISFPEQEPVPALIVNRHGNGTAVYLNFFLSDYTARKPLGRHTALSDLMRGLLAMAGVTPAQEVTAAGGGTLSDVELYPFEEGAAGYLGLVRNAPPDATSGSADAKETAAADGAQERIVNLGKRSHVYDVTAGRYLGQDRTVKVRLVPGEGKVLAMLPERPGPFKVALPERIGRGETMRWEISAKDAGYRQLARIRVTDPAGQPVACFDDIRPVREKESIAWPMALDATVGEWRVEVTNVLTGARQQCKFTVQ